MSDGRRIGIPPSSITAKDVLWWPKINLINSQLRKKCHLNEERVCCLLSSLDLTPVDRSRLLYLVTVNYDVALNRSHLHSLASLCPPLPSPQHRSAK